MMNRIISTENDKPHNEVIIIITTRFYKWEFFLFKYIFIHFDWDKERSVAVMDYRSLRQRRRRCSGSNLPNLSRRELSVY